MTDAPRVAPLVLAIVASGCAVHRPAVVPRADGRCVPLAAWVDPATRARVASEAIVAEARRRRIVLLGERHDWAEDHRWQAYVLSLLHAAHPRLVVGFEVFTPAADAALARWAAGERSASELLGDVDWERTAGLPVEPYLPLLHAVRMLGLELHGLNVDRAIVRRVAAEGFAALPDAERAGLPTPRPASPGYRARLADAWREHRCRPADDADPGFARFVEAQRTWDAVMAAALARLADDAPDAIVVAIVGRGHVEHGDGIVADLAAHGRDALALLPWETTAACTDLAPDLANAVFGIAPLASEIPEPPPSRCGPALRDQRPR